VLLPKVLTPMIPTIQIINVLALDSPPSLLTCGPLIFWRVVTFVLGVQEGQKETFLFDE
jgi:hypothetical protein